MFEIWFIPIIWKIRIRDKIDEPLTPVKMNIIPDEYYMKKYYNKILEEK